MSGFCWGRWLRIAMPSVGFYNESVELDWHFRAFRALNTYSSFEPQKVERSRRSFFSI